jgi:IS30 family transposase
MPHPVGSGDQRNTIWGKVELGGVLKKELIGHIRSRRRIQSRFTLLVKVQEKDTTSVVTALSRQIRQLPAALRRSLTWDRGMKLAQHKRLTMDTTVRVFFVTHKARGRGARMNIRTACCVSIS